MSAKESRFVLFAAFGANLFIAVSKFAAALATGSSSMLSEGIHSVVDCTDQALLLVGEKRGSRPADPEHPFGHGLEQYFWGFVVAILIFALGGGMSVWEGIRHLRHPEPLSRPAWNYAVLAVAFVSEGYSFSVAFRSLRKGRGGKGIWRSFQASKNPSVFVVLAEDAAALGGLVIALCALAADQLLGMPVWDGIGSILIGVALVAVSGVLAYETRALLTGESTGPEVVRQVKAMAQSQPGVLEAGQPLTMHFGPDQVLLNMELRFRPDMTAEEVGRASEAFRRRVQEAFPFITRIFVAVRQTLDRGGSHGLPGPA
ncbi:MAG: cation transporter [Fibrobacteres bacterium]|nr:cation transporter [Fibrobacterota bacterium]